MILIFRFSWHQILKISALVVVFSIWGGIYLAQAGVAEDIAAKNKQIEELQRQIEVYQKEIDENRSKAGTLQNEIGKLNTIINQVNLEIKALGISITQTSSEIQDREQKITEAESKLLKHRDALSKFVRLAYETDNQTLTEVLLKHPNLSDFFNDLNNVQVTQSNLQTTIENIKGLKGDLEQQREGLVDKKTDLQKLKQLQELQKRDLDGNKSQKDKILKETKGQESKYQELVKKSKLDIEAIRAQIGYLLQNGVSAEEAVRYARLAAIGAGIRPAFLLAELEQESALGSNVGKCYIVDSTSGATRRVTNGQIYAKGIHPTRDLGLFLKITAELGLDPFQTPVSCGSGWGGAMGAAQFIPSTWMGYREQVARITGHSVPNPWNFEDAFVAAGSKLSKDGANSQTRAGEVAASKRYYCGNATSTSAGCVNYANSVQRLASEIELNL